MAGENQRDPRRAPEREPLKDSRSPTPRAPQGGPPNLNAGLESLRSDYC
jgi:hypothetical protein